MLSTDDMQYDPMVADYDPTVSSHRDVAKWVLERRGPVSPQTGAENPRRAGELRCPQ
jgi:hypothetical protein